MKELLKLITVLGIICCFSAISLAYVYSITFEPIERQRFLKKINAINEVFEGFEDAAGFEIAEKPVCEDVYCGDFSDFYLIKHFENLLGVAFEVKVSGYGGDINIVMGVLPDGSVSGIKIIQHSETPGLGSLITRDSFAKQFEKKSLGADLKFTSDGGEVDAITGATISSQAVLTAVTAGLEFFREHKANIFN